MTRIYCPTCHAEFEDSDTLAMPFCSPRCRQLDLGKWFNEEFGLPWEGEEELSIDPVEAYSDDRFDE